jgi:hypothetical protein
LTRDGPAGIVTIHLISQGFVPKRETERNHRGDSIVRKSSLVSLIAGLFLLVGVSSASASTVNLIWTGTSDPANTTGIGTSTVGVNGSGVILTLDLLIGIDELGLSSAGLDLEFDVGLDNELDIVSFSEQSWANAKATRTLTQLSPGLSGTQESSASEEGQLFGFETFTLGLGAQSITLTFARMVFVTTPNVSSDSLDLFATNERDPSATVFFDNNGLAVSFSNITDITQIAAAVNLPEPQSVALLALAVGTLVAAGWRRS